MKHHRLKQTILVLLIMCTIAFSISDSAFAQTVEQTALNTLTPSVISDTTRTASQQTRITDLKNRATTEITRRTTSLTSLLATLNNVKHVNPTQKASFTTQIQNEITTLNTLQTKINSDTDLPTLRTDVQSIINSYRVYALFIPQIHLLAAADKIFNINVIINNLVTKLQTRIQQAHSMGENVTSMQATLTDLQNKLADTQIQATHVSNSVTSLTPTGYPLNKPTLVSAHTMIQIAFQDFKTIRQDATTIIQELKTMRTTSLSSSPAATVSSSATR